MKLMSVLLIVASSVTEAACGSTETPAFRGGLTWTLIRAPKSESNDNPALLSDGQSGTGWFCVERQGMQRFEVMLGAGATNVHGVGIMFGNVADAGVGRVVVRIQRG